MTHKAIHRSIFFVVKLLIQYSIKNWRLGPINNCLKCGRHEDLQIWKICPGGMDVGNGVIMLGYRRKEKVRWFLFAMEKFSVWDCVVIQWTHSVRQGGWWIFFFFFNSLFGLEFLMYKERPTVFGVIQSWIQPENFHGWAMASKLWSLVLLSHACLLNLKLSAHSFHFWL